MNKNQIAALYDSFPPEQQDMSRKAFIKKTMSTLDLNTNSRILDAMVQQKRQATQGRIQQAQIDAAIKRSR